MPLLDVNEGMFEDVDLIDVFNVFRPSQTIGLNGDATDVFAQFTNITGAVSPDRARTLQRTSDGQKQVQSIRVITPFILSVGSAVNDTSSSDADVIQWTNKGGLTAHYTVIAVMDYSSYGDGFIEATCDMIDFLPPTPTAAPVPGPTLLAP